MSDTSALVMPAASDPPARRRQPPPQRPRSCQDSQFGLGTVSERNGCSGPQSRLSESARAAGSVAGISYPNFPRANELARLSDFVGKSPAWRGLDAAKPFHFDRDIC